MENGNQEISQNARPQVHLHYPSDSEGYAKLLVSNIMPNKKNPNVAFDQSDYGRGICASKGFEFDLLLQPHDDTLASSVNKCSKLSVICATIDDMFNKIDVEVFATFVRNSLRPLRIRKDCEAILKRTRFYVCIDMWETDEEVIEHAKEEFNRHASLLMPEMTFTIFVTQSRRTLLKQEPSLIFSSIVQRMFFIRKDISSLMKHISRKFFDANTFLSLWDCSTVICFGTNNTTYNEKALKLINAAMDCSYYHLPGFRLRFAQKQNEYLIDESSFSFYLKESKFSTLLVPICLDRMVLSVVQDVTRDASDLEERSKFAASAVKSFLLTYRSCEVCEEADFP